jgi:hypothetical protein
VTVSIHACNETSVSRTVGQIWDLLVEVHDIYGNLTADAPTITVTKPDGTTTVPTLQTLTSGVYLAQYTIAAAGRHTAIAATSTHGSAAFTAFATDVTTAAQMPTLAEVKTYLGANSATDAQIQDALDTESQAQRDICAVPAAYPASLRQALKRRVARNLSMQRIPLAVLQGDAEAGTTSAFLPGTDPEVRRLEKPYLRLLVA